MALLSHIIQKKQALLDKKRAIFKILKNSLSRPKAISGTKSNIWLSIGLYGVKLLFFYTAFSLPFNAYAGVFSFISDFTHGKEADANASLVTSQTMAVLEANLGPASVFSLGGGEISIVNGSALIQETGIIGTQADLTDARSTRISIYVVRKGDSLSQIARMFDVSVNTIIWANDIKGSIHEGDELVILPISGVSRTVVKGDTIQSIAAKYKADIDDILSFNNLNTGDALVIGSTIIVPDGEIRVNTAISSNPTEKLRNAGGPYYPGYYMRPVIGGRKTQGLHGYNGIDIAASIGTPIYAAADGVVTIARASGYNGGYGSYVVISHANGTQTLYGHMNSVKVSQGQAVEKGDVIGSLGNSGKSTGPHIHFEVRGAVNPF
jgi:LysM repeat protein